MLYRFTLDLAIPERVFDKIPAARKQAFASEVRALKKLAVKINEGKDNEEMTVRASYHKCGHDEGKACEPEIDI
jgi:hypothetical protein